MSSEPKEQPQEGASSREDPDSQPAAEQKKEPQQQQMEEVSKEEFQKQFQMHEQQQKLIREEMEAESSLIGDLFPLALLMDQFSNNQGFYIKIQSLMGTYENYRKTRRDGSCFYRALAFSIFEKIVCKNNKELQTHIIKKIQGAKEHLLKAQFEGIIFEDLQEIFIERLDKKKPVNLEEVLKLFRDPEESNYIVLMLRFLTSGELRNNAILYETFIDNQIPIEMFCQLQVEPIDKQADQIQIMALLNYLEVGIKIVYLDASNSKEAYTCVLPESYSQDKVICELLYRPGHYDVLYK